MRQMLGVGLSVVRETLVSRTSPRTVLKGFSGLLYRIPSTSSESLPRPHPCPAPRDTEGVQREERRASLRQELNQ
jgi:hypothetical protein